jgi:assimilatory nitrate reductase catalytic subunit
MQGVTPQTIKTQSADHVAVATHCPYCALQCGMRIAPDGATVSGDEEFPVNNGALCVKGWTSAELLNHPN